MFFQDIDFDVIWNGIIENVYKSSVDTPTMVFSIIGDSNSFVPSPWPKAVFQTGLIEAAKNGGGTIIIKQNSFLLFKHLIFH
jgi:hypothetical protein